MADRRVGNGRLALSNTPDISTLPGLGQTPPTINIPGTHFGATVLLGRTVPIDDGGLRRALARQARAEEAKTDARLEQIRSEATRLHPMREMGRGIGAWKVAPWADALALKVNVSSSGSVIPGIAKVGSAKPHLLG